MRAFLAVVLLVALALPAGASARGGADVKAIRALVERQMTLLKQGKFRQLYATTTPRFRRACNFDRFVREGRELRRRLGSTARVDRIQVQFRTAYRAVVSYRFVRNGRTFMTVRFGRGDLYVKRGPRWYDEYDPVAC